MRADGLAAQFPVRGQQAALDRQRLRLDVKGANLAIVRQRRIEPGNFAFGHILLHFSGYQRR